MKPLTPATLRLALVAVALAVAACEDPSPPGAPVGTACAPEGERGSCAVGLICLKGVCTTTSDIHYCTPGTKVCRDGNVMLCNETGGDMTLEVACSAGCTDEGGTRCVDEVCKPEDVRCQGTELQKCNATRSGFDTFQVCDLGCREIAKNQVACVEQKCEPGSRRCTVDGKLETCDARGSGYTAAACDPGICVQEAVGVARCIRNVCTPNETRCEGTEIMKCDATGTLETVEQACAGVCKQESGKSAECAPSICDPNARECVDGESIRRCDSLGSAWEAPQKCSEDGTSVCRLVSGASGGVAAAQCTRLVCDPGAIRCTADQRWECNDDGTAEKRIDTCAFGCGTDGVCAQPTCDAGTARCNGDNIEVCRADRRGYSFERFCSGGCSSDPTRGARCAVPLCSPLTARCATAGNAVERCRPDGRGWEPAQSCQVGQTCEEGGCVSNAPACTAGDTQCNAGTLERCEALAGKPLSYHSYGACLGACAGDSCNAAGECAPFALRVAQLGTTESIPGDGRSTFLVLSDLLKGPSGLPVPDGTLVTLGITSNGASITSPAEIRSGDSDPTTAAHEVRVVEGRIDFVIKAPKLSDGTATVSVNGFVGGRPACAGSLELNVDFATPDAYVAEDFTTTRDRDGTGAVAGWDTTKGVLTVSAFDAGDGRDGELSVTSGTRTLDQSYSVTGRAYGDMYSAKVVEIRGNLLAVEGSLAAFSDPGTRMLLINMQGQSGNLDSVGSFEYLTTDGIQGGFIRTKNPVTRRYSNGGNGSAELATQKVRLIRVPQYTRVGLSSGATLTALPWDGDKGGVLVFFSSNSSAAGQSGTTISGAMTMTGRGFRGASVPSADNVSAAGEGLEAGQLNANTAVGRPGASGGGYCCGAGFVRPERCMTGNSQAGCDVVMGQNVGQANSWGNVTRTVFSGSAGSHATQGQSTCASFGPGQIYGDSNLRGVFLGGGSGSVAKSQSHSCYTQRSCCRRVDTGECCTTDGEASSACAGCNSPGRSFAAQNSYTRGAATTNYCDALGTPWNGRLAGQNGGGIILVTAADFTVTGTGSIVTLGNPFGRPDAAAAGYLPYGGTHVYYNTPEHFGGAGGSIYLRAEKLSLGAQGRVQALGQSGGGDGRVRIDAVTTDASFTSAWSQPAATVVRLEANTVRSRVVLQLDANEELRAAAALVLPAGAPLPESETTGAIDARRALESARVAVSLSADGTSFGLVDNTGALTFGTTPPRGRSAKWAIAPSPAATQGSTRGFSVRYTVARP